MAALATVQAYVDRARTLLQDTVEPYRYSTQDLVDGLNNAIMEARRLRPDLMRQYFRDPESLPEYLATPQGLTSKVTVDPMYRPAFVYYIVGYTQLRDEEDVTDARASAFISKFTAQIVSLA
jgi:hypothetical protein